MSRLLAVLGVLVAVAVSSGCAVNNGLKAQVAGANIELAKARAEREAKPILEADIPTPGGVMKIVVRAPGGSGNTQVAMPDDPWARAADRAVGVLGTAAGLYLGGEAAVNLVGAATKGVVDALKVQPAPTVVQAPAPVVVEQPAPVIVPPSDPIIVVPPDPIVVVQPDPIIVLPPDPLIITSPVFDSGTSFGP